jgi:hypothetical protein
MMAKAAMRSINAAAGLFLVFIALFRDRNVDPASTGMAVSGYSFTLSLVASSAANVVIFQTLVRSPLYPQIVGIYCGQEE